MTAPIFQGAPGYVLLVVSDGAGGYVPVDDTHPLPSTLEVGVVNIGTVKQGAAGAEAWPVSNALGATAAKQDTGNTSLASILAAVATAAKQDTGNTSLASILAALQAALGLPVTQKAATIPAATTMQSAAVANGNGTSLPVTGYAGAIVSVVSSPAMSGGTTVTFEAQTEASSPWGPINAHQIGANTLAATTTVDGDYRLSVAAFANVRARISAYSAGTVTIKGYVSPATPGLTTVAAVPAMVSRTASAPAAASVGVASAQAVAANANRKGLVLTNTSAAVISFGLGAAAVLNSGITLNPGGVWVMDEYTFTTGAVNAIASAAASNLAVQEFTT